MFSENSFSPSFSKTCTGRWLFGFNGKEKDDEWNGTSGGALDFGARIYDSRVGQFLSIDPQFREFADISPYVFCYDNPLIYIDENGEIPWPVIIEKGKQIFSSLFGWRFFSNPGWHIHKGLDFPKPANTTIMATHSGTVQSIKSPAQSGGYGNSIIILSDDGKIMTKYSHMINAPVGSDGKSLVEGQPVTEGMKIGEVGETGFADGNHLDYEMSIKDKNGKFVNVDPANKESFKAIPGDHLNNYNNSDKYSYTPVDPQLLNKSSSDYNSENFRDVESTIRSGKGYKWAESENKVEIQTPKETYVHGN